jgi:hypothetical protein
VQDSKKTIFDASNTLITKDKLGDFFAKVENLPKNHFARVYLEKRKIPKEKIETEFYYTDDFKQSVISILSAAGQPTEKYENMRDKDARIIIPFIDENQKVLGFQGRTLDPNNKVRYITVKLSSDAPKIYGLHLLDRNLDKIYVMEGPIDSMFVPNSVAVMDSNLSKVESLIHDIPKQKIILVHDNEPRSTNIVQAINSSIQKGFSIVLLPEEVSDSCKDINDLVVNRNFDVSEVVYLLDKNTYTNETTAHRFLTQLEFNKWKKVT